MAEPVVTTSKFGGTRIPFNKVDTLPLVKINEVVTIHRDGSVRYFSIGNHEKSLTNEHVVAVIYNSVSGPTLPHIIVKDLFKFDSTFFKCLLSIRAVLARYVKRSFITVNVYRLSDASLKTVGIYKTIWATELGLRAVL